MFRLYDGREKLYQWDLNRKLIVDDNDIKEVHFANCLCVQAQVCETYQEGELTIVDIPNNLLQEYSEIRVYGYDGEATKHGAIFEVVRRTKPADYVYTETEVKSYEAIEERLNAVESGVSGKMDNPNRVASGAPKYLLGTNDFRNNGVRLFYTAAEDGKANAVVLYDKSGQLWAKYNDTYNETTTLSKVITAEELYQTIGGYLTAIQFWAYEDDDGNIVLDDDYDTVYGMAIDGTTPAVLHIEASGHYEQLFGCYVNYDNCDAIIFGGKYQFTRDSNILEEI